MRTQRFSLVLCVIAGFTAIASGQGFYLKEGDQILFCDEKTLDDPSYGSFIETFVVTRFPQWNAAFIHLGCSGSPQSVAVVASPTLIVAPSAANLIQDMTAQFPRARVTAFRLTPTAAGGTGMEPADGRRPSAEFAQGDNSRLIDVTAVVRAAIEKAQAIDPVLAASILRNGAPAGEAGQLLMAQSLLQAWQAPATVTAVEIDALRGSVRQSENTTVREMESGRVIAWSQDDRALPMPVDFTDSTVALAASCSDFTRALNQQTLRIRGMAAEWYRLTIDGEPMGFFSRSRLDEGINLGGLPTPMWKQAMAVHVLTRKHDKLQTARWRLLHAPAEERQSAEWKQALEALRDVEADLLDERRAKAKPRTHDYELQPVEN
jgi:hypothetical protein